MIMKWEYVAPADLADLIPKVRAEDMDPRALEMCLKVVLEGKTVIIGEWEDLETHETRLMFSGPTSEPPFPLVY